MCIFIANAESPARQSRLCSPCEIGTAALCDHDGLIFFADGCKAQELVRAVIGAQQKLGAKGSEKAVAAALCRDSLDRCNQRQTPHLLRWLTAAWCLSGKGLQGPDAPLDVPKLPPKRDAGREASVEAPLHRVLLAPVEALLVPSVEAPLLPHPLLAAQAIVAGVVIPHIVHAGSRGEPECRLLNRTPHPEKVN